MPKRVYYVGLDETSWTLILSLLRYLSSMDDKEVSEAYGSILKEVEEQICTDEEDPISAPPD